MRSTLAVQAYLTGPASAYADHIAFGAFQWARVVSPNRLLEEADPVMAWRERLRARMPMRRTALSHCTRALAARASL